MELKLFEPRKTEPSTSNKYYVKTTYGGYNRCILGKPSYVRGSVLANCVGYAYGRFMEEQQIKKCTLSRGNAENWYGYKDGYARGKEPKLGAIICWRKGETGDSSDGAGHVAIVEKIYDDKSILISESGYDHYIFKTETLKPPYKKSGYVLQGFIYPAVEFTDNEDDLKLKVGDYVQICGSGNSRANGKGKSATSKAYKRYILDIHEGQPFPYQVGNKSGSTTGFYKASALKVIK